MKWPLAAAIVAAMLAAPAFAQQLEPFEPEGFRTDNYRAPVPATLEGARVLTTAEAEAIARGLQEIVHCDLRIVILHYSPVVDTLEGEPPGIHTYLGCERLATPIAENGADLVLHGHAHAGAFEGRIGDIPVYNVAVHVTGRNFWIFELDGGGVRRGGEVVEVREPPH